MTSDTDALRYEEWDGTEVIQTIDLNNVATAGHGHIMAPRVGRTRDILLLAEGGEVLQDVEVIVVDRNRGEVVYDLTEPRITVAEFSTAAEDEMIVGDTDGRARWIPLDDPPGADPPTPQPATPDDASPTDEVTVGATVGALAVTSDGSLTAIGDYSGTITIVDSDRTVVAELANDATFPARMAFVADGARLAVQSEDGSIVFWDVESASRIGELYRTDSLRGAMEVSPDGSMIVVPTGNGITEITIDPAAWKRLACASVNRRLSAVELTSVVPDAVPIDDPCA
jgi:WD40 repeat protein